ncbi:RNA chaperone Hfq [Clostridium putrefaciens]|nr:RNA chaperone Hfq [Clostridium putrefaciens]
MTKLTNNLQDIFLNESRKNKIPVVMYLTNGFQLKGLVKGFDNFIIILDSEGKEVLVYKHAITTITPLKPISFNND